MRRRQQEGLPLRHSVPDSIPGAATIQGYVNVGRPYGDPLPDPLDDASQAYACSQDIHGYFSLDQSMVHVPLNYWLTAAYETRILEDDGERLTWRDGSGITKLSRKDSRTIPHWIGWPLSNRDDWRQVKADVFFVWEDMCYKNGPLILPAVFRELMLPRGGFIPFYDHQVPPDVPWENVRHYRRKLNAMVLDQADAAVGRHRCASFQG